MCRCLLGQKLVDASLGYIAGEVSACRLGLHINKSLPVSVVFFSFLAKDQ